MGRFFIYTTGHGDDLAIIGGSVDMDADTADRVADVLTDKTGEPVQAREVPVFTSQPVQEGDIISGRTANTLPRGTAIARVARIDGVPVKVSSALLRLRGGWVSGHDGDCPGREINEDARYEVLFLGQPWDGPPSTAHRR